MSPYTTAYRNTNTFWGSRAPSGTTPTMEPGTETPPFNPNVPTEPQVNPTAPVIIPRTNVQNKWSGWSGFEILIVVGVFLIALSLLKNGKLI